MVRNPLSRRNWSFMYIDQRNYDVAIIHGYVIVIAEENGLPACRVKISSILSLEKYWSPIGLMEQSNSVKLKDIPELITDKLGDVLFHHAGLRISGHASPLYDDSYNIWVYAGPSIRRLAFMLRKYTLSCPSAPPELSLRSFCIRRQKMSYLQ